MFITCAFSYLRVHKTIRNLRDNLPTRKTLDTLKVCHPFFVGIQNRQNSKGYFTSKDPYNDIHLNKI